MHQENRLKKKIPLWVSPQIQHGLVASLSSHKSSRALIQSGTIENLNQREQDLVPSNRYLSQKLHSAVITDIKTEYLNQLLPDSGEPVLEKAEFDYKSNKILKYLLSRRIV